MGHTTKPQDKILVEKGRAKIQTEIIKVRADLTFAVACAPRKATRAQVIHATNVEAPGTRWRISRKRKLEDGARLPARCLDDPGRVHWLLEC